MAVPHESLFLGVTTNCTFYHTMRCAPRGTSAVFPYPPRQDDHFFEWSDLIAALGHARGQFNMLELGAGWGKWIVDASHLAKQLPHINTVVAIGVEAQPGHCRMAVDHIGRNRATGARMVCAAVGVNDGMVEFPMQTGQFGYGIQMLADGKRWGNIVNVRSIGVCTLVQTTHFRGQVIDFVSLDVQSFEHAILHDGAIGCMDTTVRIVHISLHRVENNDARPLAKAFARHGWWLVRYNPLETQHSPTAIGPVDFNDGRLTFLNPRLCRSGLYEALFDPANVWEGSYTAHPAKQRTIDPDWANGSTIWDVMTDAPPPKL